eukprot:2893573-Rhodomonas_salina.1
MHSTIYCTKTPKDRLFAPHSPESQIVNEWQQVTGWGCTHVTLRLQSDPQASSDPSVTPQPWSHWQDRRTRVSLATEGSPCLTCAAVAAASHGGSLSGSSSSFQVET